ncbi:DUF2986 domain-containing protein [Methanosarcina mazei]
MNRKQKILSLLQKKLQQRCRKKKTASGILHIPFI